MSDASPEQQRMLHAVARTAADEKDEHIRDRAAGLFGLTSLTRLTMSQARQLIDIYQKMLPPLETPKPRAMGSGAFVGFPKRVAKPADPAPSEAAMVVSAPTKPAPILPAKSPTHRFDRKLKIARGGDLEEIPW